MKALVQSFDHAAATYDRAAEVQAQIAATLVNIAEPQAVPENVLDIGGGTGFVADAALRRWPQSKVAVVDLAPSMLREAKRKIPSLQIFEGDARADQPNRYDVIFSSMMLHWLPRPREVLKHWQSWVKPGGRLYVAVLTKDSFREWRTLCIIESLKDGLWPLPPADFAQDFVLDQKCQTITARHASAFEFLRRLKATGAATPKDGHKPLSITAMRHLLKGAPRPFDVSYEVSYIALPSSNSI
jgi:malonyl-CoA O-methyltransferase